MIVSSLLHAVTTQLDAAPASVWPAVTALIGSLTGNLVSFRRLRKAARREIVNHEERMHK